MDRQYDKPEDIEKRSFAIIRRELGPDLPLPDPDVAESAKKNGTTRALAAMDKAAGLGRHDLRRR
jgi:precorrin isomerase